MQSLMSYDGFWMCSVKRLGVGIGAGQRCNYEYTHPLGNCNRPSHMKHTKGEHFGAYTASKIMLF